MWPICEEDRANCLYLNRNKATPTLSVHTPDWGLLVHTTDPGNSDSGYLVMGGARDEAGDPRLDFGYHAHMPHPNEPGNGGGVMPLGPELRAVALPAERAPVDAWWEGLEAYREYLEGEGRALLPARPLAQSDEVAAWARECVYTGWNVTREVSPGRFEVIDEAGTVARFRGLAEFYSETLRADETLHVCPLLWGVVSYAPHRMADGGAELVAALRAAAEELPSVELHPLFYVDTSCAHPGGDIPGEAFQQHRSGGYAGICHHETGAKLAYPWHPAVQEELRRFAREAIALGFEGAYHDAPFGEFHFADVNGASREYAEAYRVNVHILNDAFASNGGGVVTIEDGRLGIDAMQSRQSSLAYPFFTRSGGVPFATAVSHGTSLTGVAGGHGEGPLMLAHADAVLDGVVAESCQPRARGGMPGFLPGVENNIRHIPRLAMTPGVFGAVALDPLVSYWSLDPTDPLTAPLVGYVRAIRSVNDLRRRHRALQLGRIVPPPASDVRMIEIGTRLVSRVDNVDLYSCQVATRTVREVEYALYEDPDGPDDLLLVVGNPTESAKTVTFTLLTSDHPRLRDGFSVADEEDGATLTMEAGDALPVSAQPYGFRVIRLRGVPTRR